MADENGGSIDYNLLMQYLQQQNNSGSTTTQNNSGKAEGTAGGVMSMFAPVAGAIPYAGPLISAGLSIGGSLLQKDAAKQQTQQAANLKSQEKSLMPAPLAKGLQEKATADQLAAQGNMPGLKQYQDALMQDFATHLRAIHNSSINGGESAHAIATTLGLNNDSLDKLFGENAQYQASAQKTARDDMWNLGLMRHQNEQELFRNYQQPMLQQATALENAGFANKNTALQGILGAGSTAITSMLATKNKQDAWAGMMDMLKNYKPAGNSGVGTAGARVAGTTGAYNATPANSTPGLGTTLSNDYSKGAWNYNNPSIAPNSTYDDSMFGGSLMGIGN